MRVVKGHATENDFIIIDDRDGELLLSESFVRALCDRRAGLGADGVLRVVRTSADPEAAPMADKAPFFMDYRNADGSIAEMCGNGVRLFLRYLQSAGLAGSETIVATRGGLRRVWSEPDTTITVEMGTASVLATLPTVRVRGIERVLPGTAVLVPNPHVVVELANTSELAALDLTHAPDVAAGLPDGQNVEFIVTVDHRRLGMRVYERGVGETRSCGTGICAAVVASAGATGNDGGDWQVDVPGGRCRVSWRRDGELLLSGPAQLVAEVALGDDWLAAIGAPGARATSTRS